MATVKYTEPGNYFPKAIRDKYFKESTGTAGKKSTEKKTGTKSTGKKKK